jgi:hypothetical protein
VISKKTFLAKPRVQLSETKSGCDEKSSTHLHAIKKSSTEENIQYPSIYEMYTGTQALAQKKRSDDCGK